MAFDYTNYYELTSIKSTGTQYIDTLVSAGDVYGFDADFEIASVSGSPVVLGAYNSSSARFYFGFPSSYQTGGIWSNGNNKTGLGISTNTRTDVKWYNSAITVDGVSKGSLTKAHTLTRTLIVFGRNNAGTPDLFPTMTLYSLKLYDSANTVFHEYIPAERKSDGVYGLYDVNTDSFLTNDGTGTFTPGSRVTLYTITVSSDPVLAGTVSGGGSYPSGTSVTITATANPGYAFSQWDDGDTNTTRTITVTGDATYTAQFRDPRILPNDCTTCTAIMGSSSYYVDTGIVPSDALEIQAQILSGSGYVFGARNTNSNTSAGQLALYKGYNENSYFCYYNARTNIGNFNTWGSSMCGFYSNGNLFEYNLANTYIAKKTLATSSFTGTQNIYLFCMNNAGTPSSDSQAVISAFSIKNNGILVRNYVPVYNSTTNQYGMYDLANGTFDSVYQNYQFYLVETQSTTGGEANIQVANGMVVAKQYVISSSVGVSARTHLKAKAKAGYVFSHWEDGNGNVISTDADYMYMPSADVIAKAVFLKKTTEREYLGYKALAIQYGFQRTSATASYRNDLYADVLSASIKFDLLQRITTSIVIKEVPSLYQPYMTIFVLSPKGKTIYCGVIESIDENTLNCREPLSLYDDEFLFHPNTSVFGDNIDMTKCSVMYYGYNYLTQTTENTDILLGSDYFNDKVLDRKYGQSNITFERIVPFDRSRSLYTLTPLQSETKIENREDFFFDLFNDYGIVVEPSLIDFKLYLNSDPRHILQLKVQYYRGYDTIEIGSNVESVSDINIIKEEAENTVLYVYNSSGSSIRASFGMDVDGNIVEYNNNTDNTNLVGYTRCKPKVVTSDDDLDALKEQYLTNALYNHKITFNVNFDTGAYNLDSFTLGQRVVFYNGSDVYYSVLTGIEYNINANDDEIRSAKLTLGKVRTSLTSKLNLGKAGKK